MGRRYLLQLFGISVPMLQAAGVALAVALVVWIAFRSAGVLAQRLGPIGLNIVTRVMGILVTAIAFGLLARGIGGLLPGPLSGAYRISLLNLTSAPWRRGRPGRRVLFAHAVH